MKRFALLFAAAFALAGEPPVPPLVDAAFVKEHAREIVLVDLQGERALYEKGHLPGAVWADLEAFRVEKNYLAPVATLEARLGALGIDADTHVVVYDDKYGRTSGWLWFVLTELGHTRVSCLDGHMDGFEGSLETGPGPAVAPKVYKARKSPSSIVDAAYVEKRLGTDAVILDVRPPEQYSGEKPKKGVRPGHLPGALSLPWESFRRPDNLYKTPEEAAGLLAGIPRDREVILYCNSYVMAAHVHFQLARLGYTNLKAYDGSVEDWQKDPKRPLVTGGKP